MFEDYINARRQYHTDIECTLCNDKIVTQTEKPNVRPLIKRLKEIGWKEIETIHEIHLACPGCQESLTDNEVPWKERVS